MHLKRSMSILAVFTLFVSVLAGCGGESSGSSEIPSLDSLISISGDSEASSVQTSEENSTASSEDTTVISEENNITAVALGGSLAEMWLLAGGTLAGVSSDAYQVEGVSKDIPDVGSMVSTDVEKIVSLSPTVVLYSSKIGPLKKTAKKIESLGLTTEGINIESFDDYKSEMEKLTDMTGVKDSLYEAVTVPEKKIEDIKTKVSDGKLAGKTYIFFKAMSSKVAVQGDDYFACAMLSDFCLKNIASEGSLDTYSFEALAAQDPDYIFMTPMGDSDEAESEYEKLFTGKDGWSSLKAVKNDDAFVLPKDMFTEKPNNKWGDAYEYLYSILYGKEN